jgi:hypothetical protein
MLTIARPIQESLMRKHTLIFVFLLTLLTSVSGFAAQPAAADRTADPAGHLSDIPQPTQWPSVAPVQDRKQVKITVSGVGCGGDTGEPCNNDWGDMGTGGGTGGSTDYGLCKTNYVCTFQNGGCGAATYAHCADRVSGTPGDPCRGC